MDAEFSYNPMQDAGFTDELDRRIVGVVALAEDRVYRHVNTALNQAVNYQDAVELAQRAVESCDIESMVRDVVMNVLREIGLIDDNYRAHEPTKVDTRELDAIFGN